MKVQESGKSILNYLEKRALTKQYQKAKKNIQDGKYHLVKLKKRKPKSEGIFQFRVNTKYRAYARKEKNYWLVFSISDHQ
jgi:hypothetical protein